MKMSRGIACCCVALFLVLTSVSAVHQTLKSINDLKKVNFGPSVPKHSLLLLHWFANAVDIDNNDVMQLTFNPDEGHYGSHHYGNFEGLLDQPPWGYRYYTIGNLNQETSVPLPPYVLNPRREYVGRNRDRIIIRVSGGGDRRRIDQVYITQHYEASEHRGTQYDPDQTYQIATNLLREIREFSVEENAQTLWHLRNRFGSSANDFDITMAWGHLACLGLFLFIVIEEKYSLHQNHNRPEHNNRPGNSSWPEHNRPVNYNNNRPGNYNYNNRPGNYNNRQGNNNRLENNAGLEFNNIRENPRNPCRCIARAVCVFVIIILVAVIIFLLIYFLGQRSM